jgi:MFS transporter, SP family, galactose:H+ symporter
MSEGIAEKKVGYKGIVYWICIVASLGGLLFGLDQGFIANALPTINEVYGLTLSGGEHFSAILFNGAAIGAVLSGFLARFLGRKKSLLLAGALFVIMSGVSAVLPPYVILYWARFFLGLAVGIASFVVPLYLAEAAPAKIRGAMGTLFQLMITIGIFGISLTNVIFVKTITSHVARLPLMFVVIVVFALLMFIGAIFLPESPRWFMLKGMKDRARDVLKKVLNTDEEVELELKEMEEAMGASAKGGTVFKGSFIKVLLVGVFMMVFQQLVGINVMIYYAPTIFGYASITGIVAMMTVPLVNLLFTFPAIWLVEKWGRKKLLYVGSIMMLVTMIAAGLAFLSIGSPAPGEAIGTIPKVVLVIAVIVYIFGFAFSWGPVAWLICSEIFPLQGREVGMTITTMVNWFFGGFVIANALTIMKIYGNASLFFIFAGGCVLSMVFLYFWVPETQGVTLEEIELNLNNGKKLKDLGKSEG